tara:strand:- start:7473 stop:7616 length:144 start_codon:yes stop_codon:yes gene_type:complete
MKLGNFVAIITKYTGIKWAIKFITNYFNLDDCGCDKRQESWNDIELW